MSPQQHASRYERKFFVGARILSWIRFIWFSSVAGLLPGLGLAQDSTNAAAPGVNLAVVATPSSSFVSGDAMLTALTDGSTPPSSRATCHGSYGNWPRTGTQWVEYDWSQPISTKQMG